MYRTQKSKRVSISPEVVAITAALVSLVATLGILGILKRLELQKEGVIVTLILLLPLFVYLVISGKLKEFSAPGGWFAKFTQTYKEKLTDLEWIPPVPIRVHQVYQEPSEAELRQNPNMLEVVLDQAAELSPLCDYLYYLGQRLAGDAVRYVSFIDEQQKFLALIPVTSISRDPGLNPPEGECRAWELVEWMCQGNIRQLKRLKGFVPANDAAEKDWSKKDCLREMYERNLEAMPIVDDGYLTGIVERERLMISALVDASVRLED